MDEKEATEILCGSIQPDNGLMPDGAFYVRWFFNDNEIQLDGEYTEKDLEAFLWWMKNKRLK